MEDKEQEATHGNIHHSSYRCQWFQLLPNLWIRIWIPWGCPDRRWALSHSIFNGKLLRLVQSKSRLSTQWNNIHSCLKLRPRDRPDLKNKWTKDKWINNIVISVAIACLCRKPNFYAQNSTSLRLSRIQFKAIAEAPCSKDKEIQTQFDRGASNTLNFNKQCI